MNDKCVMCKRLQEELSDGSVISGVILLGQESPMCHECVEHIYGFNKDIMAGEYDNAIRRVVKYLAWIKKRRAVKILLDKKWSATVRKNNELRNTPAHLRELKKE